MSTPLLRVRDLEVAYGNLQILFGIDLEVHEGEIVALLGTNGAGKSTLLKAVSQLVAPRRGTIELDGVDVTAAGPRRVAELGAVQVPGGKATFPTLTVAEHFRLGRWALEAPPAVLDERQEEVLDLFPRLRERWDQLGGNLSGGEQQQLAVGLALVARPRLLMIDELSLGLSPIVVTSLLDAVRRLNEHGTTVVVVEQSVNVACELAARAWFLEKGQVRWSGATEELLERDDLLRSVFLAGAAVTASPTATAVAPATGPGPEPVSASGRSRGPRLVADPDPEAGLDLTGGRDLAGSDAAAWPHQSGAPALAVDGLVRRFGGVTAVDDVSFAVGARTAVGLIGANGAGKTTIFDLVSGALPVDEGRISLAGVDVTSWSAARRARAGLGRSFQDARIFPSLSVGENLALGLDRHLPARDHLAAALDLPAVQQQEVDVAFTVEELVELFGLGDHRRSLVRELSTGTRRVVDLAMAVGHGPDVLLLDEPSAGIAQREVEALVPVLHRIRAELGCALLVIDHDIPLVAEVTDELLALDLGRVIARGPSAEVLADPAVVAAYLGGDPAALARSGRRRRRAPRGRGSRPAAKRAAS